ncbi:MAG: Ig-like domain-containing protein [Spirochaetota bacterium]|nr:Ig-like domain-containing protein [Spirochaetota bacterium]
MRDFKKKYLVFLALVALSLFLAGCILDDSKMSNNIAPPSASGVTDKTLPQVNAFTTPALVTYSSDGLVDTAVAPYNHRCVVTFSEVMSRNTITSSSVYVRDVSSTPAVISGQTVTISEDGMTVYVEWSSSTDYTAVELEAVVESTVTDLSGNGIAGLVTHFGATYPFTDIVADYREDIGAAWTDAPSWRPATVTLSQVNLSATSVTVTAQFNTLEMDPSTITASNFSVSGGGTIGTLTDNLAVGGDVSFGVTGLTENTEYTVTFSSTGAAVDITDVNRLYPDGATTLATLDDYYMIDDYDLAKGNRSSYTLEFMMQNSTLTIPTLVGASDQTATILPGYTGGTDRMIQIQFSVALDEATLTAANFIVKDNDAPSKELSVTVSPYYLDGDTELVRVLISTMDYSEDAIQTITIRSGVTCSGAHVDGDGDGALEGDADYDQNDAPDDWVTLTNGVHF